MDAAGQEADDTGPFDMSGKSGAGFHRRAIGAIVHGATIGLSARLQARPVQTCMILIKNR
jgi:hypothetical protein